MKIRPDQVEICDVTDARTAGLQVMATVRLAVTIDIRSSQLYAAKDPGQLIERAKRQAVECLCAEPERYLVTDDNEPLMVAFKAK